MARRWGVLGTAALAMGLAACSSGGTASPPQPTNARTQIIQSTSGTVGVPASTYKVVVAAVGPCFVQATSGSNAGIFLGMVAQGQTRTFSAVDGKLSVEFGSVQVTVTVRINGRAVPGWQFTPTVAPFTLHFASTA